MVSSSGHTLGKRFSRTPFAEFRENIAWEPTERVTTLSKLLFRAPDPKKVALLTFILGLVMGLLIDLGPGGVVYGIFVFALAAHASAYASMRLIEYYGERFFLRRAMLTSFTGLVIVAIVLVIGKLVHPLLGLGWRFLVIYGYCLDLAMRYLVIRTSCIKHRDFTFLVSSLTMVFVFLLFLPLTFLEIELLPNNNLPSWEETRFIILSVLSLLGTAFLFTEVVNAPMKNEFGLSATDLLGYFLSYMTIESRELETLFHRMEEEVSVPLRTLVFRRVKDKATKLVSVLPGVHPGPLGDLGGGDLPSKLQVFLRKANEGIMCFHGCSSNDLNPVSNEECEKVASAAGQLVAETDHYIPTATPLRTAGDGSRVSVQLFGENALILHESENGEIDDIGPATGVLTEVEVKERGIDRPVFVDCHNHASKTAKILDLGHELSGNIVGNAVSLTKRQQGEPQYPFRLGYHQEAVFSREEGLGSMGIQTMVLELQMKDEGAASGESVHRIAYVLCDGNNMLPEFKKAAEELCLEFVDDVRVMTTDNHVVNAVIGGYNPIGEKTNLTRFLEVLKDSLSRALGDLEEAEVGFNSGELDGVKVIGHGNSLRLATVINNTVTLARHALLPFLILAFLSSAMAYYLA